MKYKFLKVEAKVIILPRSFVSNWLVFSLSQLSDYAKGRGLSSVSVSGMPTKDGKTLAGTWSRDSGWVFQDAGSLLWKCDDSLSKTTFYGWGPEYLKFEQFYKTGSEPVPELASKAFNKYRTLEWIVVGYCLPNQGPKISGKYTSDATGVNGKIVGTTDDGTVYARWGQDAYKLIGVSGEWLQRNGESSAMFKLEVRQYFKLKQPIALLTSKFTTRSRRWPKRERRTC